MRALLQPLIESEAFQALLTGDPPRTGRVEAPGFPYVVAALAEALERPILVVAPAPREAARLAAGAAVFLGQDRSLVFPAWEALPGEGISPAPEIAARRARAARAARGAKGPLVVVAPVVAALQRVAPALGAVEPLTMAPGQETAPDALAERLMELGYERTDLVLHRGEMALRGGILDVFPGTGPRPVRLEFFGDQIEKVREFSASTQTSTGSIGEAVVHPVRELLPSPEVRDRAERALRRSGGAMRDALARLADGLVFEGMEGAAPLLFEDLPLVRDLFAEEPATVLAPSRLVRDRARAVAGEAEALAEATGAPNAIDGPEVLDDRTFDLTELSEGIDLGVRGWDALRGRADALAERAAVLAAGGTTLALTAEGRGSIRRAQEVLDRAGVPPIPEERTVESGLLEGFVFAGGVAVIGEDDLFGRRRSAHEAPRLAGRSAASFAEELTAGDFVVHRVHGVGRYLGMTRRRVGDAERDYLLLEYASADRLYVPAEQVDVVSRYVGGEKPRLHRLGSSDWVKAKGRVRRAVRDMAGELVRLYTARMSAEGHAFAPDTPWQRELEDAFPHQETRDQLTTIEDVKRDMEAREPMDRLIAGDVGFGKTEIAVRAAFKAVQDGKQVAVLVPTTLLAEQHHVTFGERFAPFPVRVAMLSRFLSPAEERQVMRGLADGSIDVVVGTHRLLSADIRFKDLGLLIVDEEQRFGVSHKERLKKLRVDVDVLTMSATPIPRTLEMALAGVRKMSVVDTPPEDRQPVLTYVGPYDQDTALGAVRRELRRGGQVFWVHNEVRTIDRHAGWLEREVPDARIGIAHGQMDEASLEKAMIAFWAGEADVLVCSTIIESGLDVPSANTLVVDRADKMGLSQLYQLRGRVGRSAERAFAYLFFPPQAALSEEAHQRLAALSRLTELGSGLQVAMRDLEIRGAGNLLGAEQSGHVAAVGFDTYLRLLAEEVAEMRGQPQPEEKEVRIDLPVRAFIPPEWLGQERLRLELYRKVSSARSDQELDALREETEDRFGDLPPEVVTLFDLARVRVACLAAGIEEVTTFRGQVRLRPVALEPDAALPEAASHHVTTGTLNLDPPPSEMGSRLPSWIRARLDQALSR